MHQQQKEVAQQPPTIFFEPNRMTTACEIADEIIKRHNLPKKTFASWMCMIYVLLSLECFGTTECAMIKLFSKDLGLPKNSLINNTDI